MKKPSLVVVSLILLSLMLVGLSTIKETRATTHYVGGGGPGNHTTIQEAIDAASPGDTVYVYPGLYVENLIIDRTLTLLGEDRGTTTVDGSGTADVIEVSADGVTISGLTITNGGTGFTDAGVDLSFTQNCMVVSSNISANGFRGFRLLDAGNSTIQDNIVSENTLGFSLESAYHSRIVGNSISTSGAGGVGINLEYSYGNTISGNDISGGDDGIILIFSDGNTVSGSTISSNWRGIYLSHSNGNTITLNNISLSSNKGMSIDSSQGNIVSYNMISSSPYGIHLDSSNGNDIVGNTASLNDQDGIHLFESENNRVLRNSALSNLGSGITFIGPGPNTFSENTVRLNQVHGMYFELSGASVITGNTVEDNGEGIHLQFSWFNQVYHNSFINNTLQAYDDGDTSLWDNGYPSGGNYWNDYAGIDDCSGPNQDICPDSDWIGDTPYAIDADSEDRYPLMIPYGELVPEPPTMTGAELSGIGLEDLTLSWLLSPDDGAGSRPVVEYQVYRNTSYDSKAQGYSQVASLPNGTSFYVDFLAGEGNANNYFYLICGRNDINRTTCAENQAGKFTRSLAPGPNLVSLPLIQSNESIETVLQTVQYNKAWSYNSSSQEWKTYMESKPYKGSLDRIDHRMGIWVNVTENSNLTIAGVVSPQPTIYMRTGWNLVSFPSFNMAFSVKDLKATIGATRVEGCDPAAPPNFLRVLGDVEMLQAGEAYWVRVGADVDWMVKVS